MSEIAELISTVGFPIVMALLLFYDRVKLMSELRKSIEANTVATQQLVQAINEK